MTSSLVPSRPVDPDTQASLVIYERLKPLKDALGIDKLSDGELHLFAVVARHTGLDPFTKQIYAIKRGGKVTHQTGIDGYRSVAERTSQYAGSDEAEFEECDCGGTIDGKVDSPAQHPRLARVVVHRVLPSGHVVDQVGVARWHELKPEHRTPQGAYEALDAMWWRMPYNQLAKCAEANGLRKAFPRVLGGVYIAEEMQGQETVEGEATEVPTRPAPASIEDRVAARRAQAEEGQFRMTPIEQAPQSQTAQEPVTDAVAVDIPDPVATGLCGAPSPYDEGEACGIAADVRHPMHRVIKDGKPTSSWANPGA